MNAAVLLILNVLIVVMVLLLPFAFYRAWIGRGLADRLLALEMISALLIGLSILIGLRMQTDVTIDVGIVLAALGFAATLSVARYIAEGRVF